MSELDYSSSYVQPEEERRRGLFSILLGRGPFYQPSPVMYERPVDPGFTAPRSGERMPIDPGFVGPRTPSFPPALAASPATLTAAENPQPILGRRNTPDVPPPLVSRATAPLVGGTAPSVPPPLVTRGEAEPPAMRRDAPPILGAGDRYLRYVQEAPQREDFAKYELKPWQKIVGGTLATLAGTFSHNPEIAGVLGRQLFNRPEMKYQGALGEYEKRLGQYKTAADVEREQAEERRKQEETTAKLNAPPGFKRVDAYTNEQGQHVEVFANDKGEIQERVGGKVLPGRSTVVPAPHTTDFGGYHWQYDPGGKLPGPRQDDWVRLGVSNRQRDEGETPAQRLARQKARNQAEREKGTGLRQAEQEIRRRYGLTGFAATEPWPQEAIDELEAEKQRTQDEYEQKLGNLGEDVRHFDYNSQRSSRTSKRGGQVTALDRTNPDHRRIAEQILNEAGGDVDKARQIARQRGYRF